MLDTDLVGDAFPEAPLAVAPTATIGETLRVLKQHRHGSVLVCEDGQLLGIFTERDALKRMAGGGSLDAAVADVMTPRPVTVSRRDTVGEAIRRMANGGYRHLPVVDDEGRPTGIVSVRGILHYLVEHFPSLVYTLPPNPHHRPHDREGA